MIIAFGFPTVSRSWLIRPRSTRPSITLCMMPRLTKRSTHLESTLRCPALMLNESVSSSTVRNSPRPQLVVFVTLMSLTSNVLPLKVNMLPPSSLQTTFFMLLLHLQPPVRQHSRLVLRHASSRQMFITFVVFLVASVVPPTLRTATTPCAATNAFAPLDVSTLLCVMLLTMT